MEHIILLFKKGMELLRHGGVGKLFIKVKRYFATPHPRWKIYLPTEQESVREREELFAPKPVFSILTPLYNTPEPYLRELIESVLAQTYPHWQLCLADASDEAHAVVGEIARDYAQADSRVVYRKLAENEGISGNTNRCMELATGDYFAPLDHDDVLHPSALYCMKKAIDEEDADMVFTDEAKFISSVKKAYDPYFKPDFSREELRACNYICHFIAFSRTLAKEAGPYRPAFDGSQDHDMILRLTERARRIAHVSKVLYFWRVHPGSVSYRLGVKQYAVDAGKNAVLDQMRRSGEVAEVQSHEAMPTSYRVRYAAPKEAKVTFLLHGKGDAAACRALLSRRFSEAEQKSLPFGASAEQYNEAIKHAAGDYIFLLNTSLREVSDEWMNETLSLLQKESVAAVGQKPIGRHGRLVCGGITMQPGPTLFAWYQGMIDGAPGYQACLEHVRRSTAVWSGAMAIKKRCFEMLGGFSEELEGEFAAVDFCLRARKAGLETLFTPFARAIYDLPARDVSWEPVPEKFRSRWAKEAQRPDPNFNPNLTSYRVIR